MVVNIGITIEGLNQTINFMSKFPQQLKTEQRNQLNVLGDKGVKIYQKYAHVQTGYMKAHIKKTKVSDRELEITSQAKYSAAENRRGGPHAFWDKGTQELTKVAKQEFTNAINRVISRKGL